MNGAIYVLRDDGKLEPMSERQYDSEDLLQGLLARYPSILAGDQISPSAPRNWLLVRREAEVPGEEGGAGRWSLDHLFLDQDGIPTLVEVKRSSDTRIRREVVGQMLDYAANAMAYWSLDSIRANFERTAQEQDHSPDDVLAEFLGPEADPAEFWERVKTNLQAGKLRLLFVADEIPEELRRVIEFLNSQMDPAEVLGVEIRQFAGESLKTLVPRVVGQTAEAERRKGPARRSARAWDEMSFFNLLAERDDAAAVGAARRILEWAGTRGAEIRWDRGVACASFSVLLWHGSQKHNLFNVHTGEGRMPPGVSLKFQYQANKPPFNDVEKRQELLRHFNAIPGVSLPDDAIDRRPSIPLVTLSSADAMRKFVEAADWCVAEIKKTWQA